MSKLAYSTVWQLPRLKMVGIKLGLIAALAFAGMVVSTRTATAQSLAELLCAVQKRQQLLIDRQKTHEDLNTDAGSSANYDYSPGIKLIDWGIGKNFPGDSDVNKLSIEDRIQLLQKAYNALNYLADQYFSPDSTVNRSLLDIQDSIGGSDGYVPISIANYQKYLRAMSRWVEALQETDWPVRYHLVYGLGEGYSGLPETLDLDWSVSDDISPDDYVDNEQDIYLSEWGEFNDASEYSSFTGGGWCGDSFIRGSANYSGQIDFYVCPGFGTQAISGLTSKLPGLSGSMFCPPGDYLVNSVSTHDETSADIGAPPGALGGDTNGVSIHGEWEKLSDVSAYFQPLFSNQTSTELTDYSNPIAYSGGTGYIFSKFLSIKSRFKPDFGTEFSSSLPKVPEAAPALKIIPDFSNSRILVRLSNWADNQCSLIWNFALDAVASRNVLQAGGSGDWDAVYSGKPEDREPELVWIGGEYTKNGRWRTFDDYVADWWRPVLKQLICDTYGVNIIQKDRFQYEVDFYRRDQFGKKDATTGAYDFSGATPVDKLLVSNPAGDDSDTGHLRIVVHSGQSNEATYNITLTQQKDSNGTVTQSTWDFNGANISKEVAVMPSDYDYSNNTLKITREKTVVDNTTIDGVAQPKVTTTYWDWNGSSFLPAGEWIDAVTESDSRDGTRVTKYTYDWKNYETYSGSGDYYYGIDHLTQIQQSGGSNPYTANYDDAEQLTSYSDTWGSETVAYSGNTVTHTQKINGQPVRTLVTTYSGDMSTVTTTAQ